MIQGRIKRAWALAREGRVELLFQNDQVTQFYILGRTRDYLVTCNKNGAWWCSCKDHEHRKGMCKHILACIFKIKGDFNEI